MEIGALLFQPQNLNKRKKNSKTELLKVFYFSCLELFQAFNIRYFV